jgi:DNA-binding CsgD family transcriptional regulator
MSSATFDPVSVVERAYEFDRDAHEWLESLNGAVRGFFPSDVAVSSCIVDMRDGWDVAAVASSQAEADAARAARFFALDELPEEIQDLFGGSSLSSMSDVLGQSPQTHPALQEVSDVACTDYLGAVAYDPQGFAIQIGAEYPRLVTPRSEDVATWERLTAHIAHGHRLQHGVQDADLDASDALVRPHGGVEYVRDGELQQSRCQRALSQAAVNLELARAEFRRDDPSRALDLWPGLLDGTYSLVEQFDTDGKRYYVVRRNDPRLETPAPLSMRERQVTAYVALGKDNRCVAYTLGLSESTVATYLDRALKKLGLDSRADLIRLVRSTSNRPE